MSLHSPNKKNYDCAQDYGASSSSSSFQRDEDDDHERCSTAATPLLPRLSHGAKIYYLKRCKRASHCGQSIFGVPLHHYGTDWTNVRRLHQLLRELLSRTFDIGKPRECLKAAKDCKSLLKKYLTQEVFDKLKNRKTAMGATLLDVIQSGVENLDSGVGVYAPDAESYRTFAELFDPVIDDYHKGFKRTDRHPPTDFGDLSTFKNVDPSNEFVVSTRIRCARSLEGYPFNPCLTESQYKEMERKVTAALRSLDGELSGTYYPLKGMQKDVQQQLIDDHFLFKEGDRFLQAANSCRFWPTGRGIFHNDAKTFLVWVNEEDHLRIISMQKGGNIREASLLPAGEGGEGDREEAPFSRDDRFGYLTFCPTNLGTTIRASVHIKVPKLAKDKSRLDAIAAKYELQVRGTRVSIRRARAAFTTCPTSGGWACTEYEAVRTMQEGILDTDPAREGRLDLAHAAAPLGLPHARNCNACAPRPRARFWKAH
ncbi:hypothetical protein HPB48_014583 [Haemaphysalis longicornis]|uniref:Arginine kinase n=1 Tax=Haemaphysalis longicornis TaxID=44386 RepID=A0A9J6GA79_HAELO|nr:hypothetical protein HPB48_014583 [Haemaphysalis longicornis]